MNGLFSVVARVIQSDERTHRLQEPTFLTPLSITERQASDEQLYGARNFRLTDVGLV